MSIWDVILNIGSIAGLFGVIGATYLYFENKRFKKLEAEKEYRLAQIELIEINEKIKQDEAVFSLSIDSIIRGSKTRDVLEMNRRTLDELENKKFEVTKKYSIPKSKTEAKIDYYKKLKDHSFFWFFKKDKNINWWDDISK